MRFRSPTLKRIDKQVSKMVSGMNPSLKASLGTDIVQYLSLPYWTRIWIVQELMLPPEKTMFSEMGEIKLTLFANAMVNLVIEHVETELQDVIMSLPGYQFMWSQYTLSFNNFDRTLETPLLSLMRTFAHSGCFNKLDRVYALLSLAQNGHEFPIDYDVDLETLFRRTMLFVMNNRPLDDFLLAGATFIEALELRPIRTPSTMPEIGDASHSSEPTSSMEKMRDSCLLIHYDRSISVASPVWGEAFLDIADDSGHLRSRYATPCLYLAIYDAGDVHIFEYTVEEDDSGVYVKYARAHEYVRGKPQICKEPLDISKNESYLWVDLPSEKVHYYKDPAGTRNNSYILPNLIEWTTPQLKLEELPTVSFDDHSATAELRPRRLKPAKRYLVLDMPWSDVAATRATTLFQSAKGDIQRNELELQLQYHTVDDLGIKLEISNVWKLPFRPPASGDPGLKLLPQTPRSATLRLAYKGRDSKESDGEDSDGEESG
jgi:hypothetical protein